ncbi:di-heme-cytochrome C peroxidase [Bosea sp. 2YAB26]|uniref:di-heme-cytochrome C peroxidase n=1 Tax=Bosea sp. 2YAB26 TaxID=3237478 RepID=UPI003F935F2F
MKKANYASLLAVGSCLAVSASAQQAAPPATSPSVVYLNQAWSQEDREWYYNFSQGSAIITYDLYLNLEVANSQDLFRSDANNKAHGLTPQSASANNRDGLPIGVTKTAVSETVKGWPAGDYAGLTCAACHQGQLNYKDKAIRIDGGIATAFDIQRMIQSLNDAVQATLTDAAKFDRLAGRLGATAPDGKDKLRKRVESEAERVNQYATRTSRTSHPWGPGRMDALSLIINRTTATLPGIPENWAMAIAPVKPPFLWNAPQGLWTQWGAFAQNPIGRNFGETLGVYLPVDLSSKSPAEGLFQSNAAILDLGRVEKQLERLAPPSWPEEVFGRIDRDKAKVGKGLFVELCASCHNAWPYRWTEPNKHGKQFVLVGLTPQTYVGTDRAQIEAPKPLAFTGELSKFLPPEFRGQPFLPPMLLNALIGDEVRGLAIAKLKLTEAQLLDLRGYRELPTPRPAEHVYKAAPRDGVWATPPFLHNGSVPNLYEMLIPAAERTKKFYLGGDFDPVKVGLDTTATSGTFLVDTSLLGNSNAGHSFQNGPRGNGIIGPLLAEQERWALVEYLKSIPEEPGRVTPFGGPAQASLPPRP